MFTGIERPAPGKARPKWAPVAIIAALAVLAGSVFLFSSSVHNETERAYAVLSQGDLDVLRDYIRSFGVWSPFVSLLLMVIQAVAAPIPSFLVVFANGLAFGLFWGWVLSLVGQLLAAGVCFWLARSLGRGPVSVVLGRFGLDTADRWFTRWGAHAVLITRLIPGMAFDSVSYAAGLTRMNFPRFLAATAAGAAPSTLLYVYLGQRAPRYGWILLTATLLLTGLFALPVIVQKRRAGAVSGAVTGDRQQPPTSQVRRGASLLVEEIEPLRVSVVALLGLLAYLIAGQVVAPGSTDYWGYLVVQIAVVILALGYLDRVSQGDGGLSLITSLIVAGAVYVDTFGNVTGMYGQFAAYDKFVHTVGAAALAAFLFELLSAYRQPSLLGQRTASAIGLAMAVAVIWEMYEFVADQLFLTYRHAGTIDTTYDLIFGAIGATTMSLFLSWRTSPVRQARELERDEVRYARLHGPKLAHSYVDTH